MGWSIALLENTVEISETCAKDLFAAQEYEDETWYELDDVTYEGYLSFNGDHMEHMDYLDDEKYQAVLKTHKVEGDICFGDVEGDNAGSFWGYRFDGKGGMVKLTGRIVFEEVKEPFKGQTFVFTGKLEGMTRDEAKRRVEELGGEVRSSLSRNTTWLVTGSRTGSKVKRAEELGVVTMSQGAFAKILEEHAKG